MILIWNNILLVSEKYFPSAHNNLTTIPDEQWFLHEKEYTFISMYTSFPMFENNVLPYCIISITLNAWNNVISHNHCAGVFLESKDCLLITCHIQKSLS